MWRRELITKTQHIPTFAGRRIGIVILVSVQSLIGIIHVSFGLWLLSVSTINLLYSVYTLFFGIASLLFALGVWMAKIWGWLGTVAILLFVTIADTLTLLNLPSIPGIPRLAAVAEIVYSVILLIYLVQPQTRAHALFEVKIA